MCLNMSISGAFCWCWAVLALHWQDRAVRTPLRCRECFCSRDWLCFCGPHPQGSRSGLPPSASWNEGLVKRCGGIFCCDRVMFHLLASCHFYPSPCHPCGLCVLIARSGHRLSPDHDAFLDLWSGYVASLLPYHHSSLLSFVSWCVPLGQSAPGLTFSPHPPQSCGHLLCHASLCGNFLCACLA